MQDHQIGGGLPARQLPDRLRAVGPGWHTLLLRLHTQLVALGTGYSVDDLKEKLGAVRIHITVSSVPVRSGIRGLVTAAEEKSATVCEFCGSTGSPETDRHRLTGAELSLRNCPDDEEEGAEAVGPCTNSPCRDCSRGSRRGNVHVLGLVTRAPGHHAERVHLRLAPTP